MSTPVAHYVCVDVFSKTLKELTIAEQEPNCWNRSGCSLPASHSHGRVQCWEGVKTVFNLVPCDNQFETRFREFLNNAEDVKALQNCPSRLVFPSTTPIEG